MSQIHKINSTQSSIKTQTTQVNNQQRENKVQNTQISNQQQRTEQTKHSNSHQNIMDAHAVQRRGQENQDNIKNFKRLHARQLNQRLLSLEHKENIAQAKAGDKASATPKPSLEDLEEVSALLNAQQKDKKNIARMVRQFQHRRAQGKDDNNYNYANNNIDVSDDEDSERLRIDRKQTKRINSSPDVLHDLRLLGNKEDPTNMFILASAIQQDKNTSPEDKKRVGEFVDNHYAVHKERIHADFNIADAAHTAGKNKDGSYDAKKITQFTEKYYVISNMAAEIKDTASLLFDTDMSIDEYKKETDLFGMAAQADIDGRRLATSNHQNAHAALSFAHKRTGVLSGLDTMLNKLVQPYSKIANSLLGSLSTLLGTSKQIETKLSDIISKDKKGIKA